MTSELRHPVYVWRDACIAYGGLSIEGTDAEYKAAAVIEAYGDEREAKGRAKQAAELAKFKALAETLAGALEKIAEGTYPRPLGKPWRMDASSSKHDRCIHDAWMYETCEGCLDAFVAEALRQYKEARDAS